MATRTKTVSFNFPTLTIVANNTQTPFTQITVYLPETGTKTIKHAWVEVSMDDIITATGGTLTTKTIDLSLNGASYTSTTNSNTLTNSGENHSFIFVRDFTSHFVTNYSGTSATCDLRLQINQSTGTTPNMVNVNAILYITYEYDDTSTTHVKTVYIPLNAPVTQLPNAKTSHDTLPALDTYLPEASKVYRSIHVVLQYNLNQANTTDHTVSMELASTGAVTTENYEASLATDRFTRYVWNVASVITTGTGQTFNVWASITGRCHSMQAYLVVTYEFNATTSTSIMNSLLLPMDISSPLGTSSSVFQRSNREFWVQETNPTRQRLAAYVYWNNNLAEAGLNFRVGTGSFVAYTNGGSAFISGNKVAMIRNDSPTGLSFGRGRNSLQLDGYNTASAGSKGGNVGCMWMLNYTSDKHSDGVGAHNTSVFELIHTHGTGSAIFGVTSSAFAPVINEANYFITACGLKLMFTGNSTFTLGGPTIQIEQLTAENNGVSFLQAYADGSIFDGEAGSTQLYCQVGDIFNRWSNDFDSKRLPIETARIYNLYIPTNNVAAVIWEILNMYLTYHSITYTFSGTISGSAGGTVTIGLYRTATGEKVLETTRSGNGAYSFTWFDDTEDMYVCAVETSTLRGLSKDDTPDTDFDIDLVSGGAGYTENYF